MVKSPSQWPPLFIILFMLDSLKLNDRSSRIPIAAAQGRRSYQMTSLESQEGPFGNPWEDSENLLRTPSRRRASAQFTPFTPVTPRKLMFMSGVATKLPLRGLFNHPHDPATLLVTSVKFSLDIGQYLSCYIAAFAPPIPTIKALFSTPSPRSRRFVLVLQIVTPLFCILHS
jgi:hypothetical protein